MNTPTHRFAYAIALSLLLIRNTCAAPDEPSVRAFVNDSCIIADEPFLVPPAFTESGEQTVTKMFPLVGIVVGKLTEVLVKYMVSAAAEHIKSGGARKDTRYAMTREVNLYRAEVQPAPSVVLNGKLGCMTVVAAKFKPDPSDCSAQYLPKDLPRAAMNLPQSEWRTSRTDDSLANQLRRANICVDGEARAVYEARFEFSDDGTAYRLRNAGYRVERLLTTDDKKAARNVFYTLEISQPGKTDQRESLSTAWINLGRVAAGDRGVATTDDSPAWLRVPGLSLEARRAYEDQTRIHQETMAEIEATRRAIVRNQRLLTALDQRIATASADVVAGLSEQRVKSAVQIQALQAELEVRMAEYQDLPQKKMEFMPVLIEVGVTETRSEKKALLALASVVDSSSSMLASMGASATTGFVSRSLNVSSEQRQHDVGGELETARAEFFDAVVEFKAADKTAADSARERMARAKLQYNTARRALGLVPVE